MKNGEDAPLYKDATRGWAYLTAKELQADWSVIATSGITATKGIGWAGADTKSMYDQYLYTDYYYFQNQYSFARQPDVIVVGLGTNDMWTYASSGATFETVQKGFVDLLKELREKNPRSKILWLHGMMLSSADSMVKKAVKEMGGAEKGFYSLVLPLNTDGGNGHPGLKIQSEYAGYVSSYIKRICNINDEADITSSQESSKTVSATKPSSKANQAVPSATTIKESSLPVDSAKEENAFAVSSSTSAETKDESVIISTVSHSEVNGAAPSKGKIIGLSGAVIALVAAIGGGIFLWRRKRKTEAD